MKKYIILILLSICCICITIHISYTSNKFDKNNVVFEFYAQRLFPYIENNEEIRVSYYIGIDKHRNLYARGGDKSNSLYYLWVPFLSDKRENKLYIGEENMTLNDYIPNPVCEIEKKLSKEEYKEIVSLMDEVEKNWKADNPDQTSVFQNTITGNSALHFFKYKGKYYRISTLVIDRELGSLYERWGEKTTNNIIKVRGIIDKYIDSSLDPDQFNFAEWTFHIDTIKYGNKYSVPPELPQINNDEKSLKSESLSDE